MSIEWTDVSGSGAVTAEEKMYPYVNPIEVSDEGAGRPEGAWHARRDDQL